MDIAGRRSKKGSELFNYSNDDIYYPPISYGKTTIKTGGFIPTFAARAGIYFPKIDSIVYVRVGFTFLNNKFENTVMRDDITCQKISPIVGLGIEKSVFGRCTIRVEGDYRFSANKTKHLNVYDIYTINRDRYSGQIKNKVRGYAIRLFGVYHF